MSLPLFIIFTALGAGIWVVILALSGYLIGNNQELIGQYLQQIMIAIAILCLLLVVGYVFYKRKQLSRRTEQES